MKQKLKIETICPVCSKLFVQFSGGYIKKFCSRKCANSIGGKSSLGISRKRPTKIKQIKICLLCDSEANSINSKYCLKHKHEALSKAGRASAQKQSKLRRSSNEIEFGNLCYQHFKSVRLNESIFNGWDADVIIDDIKVAILWNGKYWHSNKQTKNRDAIKIAEIIKLGYAPLVIIDPAKKNSKFVYEQFQKLLREWSNGGSQVS